MRARLLSFVAVLVVLTALATPALAGGWASVRLDGPPPPPFQEVPWTVGFTVKQHDRTPINVDRAFLSATHRTTGETFTADAVQDGDVGHYTVTAVFPTAGEWKWSITPEPFEGTSFPTLSVAAGPAGTSAGASGAAQEADTHPVHIHSGTCANLGDVVFPLNETGSGMTVSGTPVAAGAFVGATSAVPVAISVTTVAATIESLADGNHAINVHKSADDIGTYVACGDIGGPLTGDDLIVGLQQLNNSGDVGVAVLHGEGTETTVTLYMLVVQEQNATASAATGVTAEVKLVGGTDGDWHFEPASLEVDAGTTVTWTNETDVAHTVSGANLDFEDSGYLDPGQSFSQTFPTPGVYFYKCDPHPWMTGEIVVT